MIILLTITVEHMEAALYETGPLLSYVHNTKTKASLAVGGPLLSYAKKVVSDYHDLLGSLVALESRVPAGESVYGIVAVIGPVSFTRHRQTIALLNAFGATRTIPVAALEYTDTPPTSHTIATTVSAISKTTFQPLAPRYRAAPTITISKKVPVVLKK